MNNGSKPHDVKTMLKNQLIYQDLQDMYDLGDIEYSALLMIQICRMLNELTTLVEGHVNDAET